MLQMLQRKNPDKEYPANTGAKWYDEEDKILLEEIANNIDFETIAKNHKRTIGGIHARIKVIAYDMFLKECSIEAIMEITKMSNKEIETIINKKRQLSTKKINKKELQEVETKQIIKNDEIQLLKTEVINMKSDIVSMRNEIFELKKTINSLAEMLKLVYEFESEQ